MGTLALRTRDYTNITGVQATPHGDVRYSTSSVHECLLSQSGQCLDLQVYGINSSGLWDKLDILGENFTLPQEFLVEKFSGNVKFLQNTTKEITAEPLLLSIVEIVDSVQKIGLVLC